MAGNLREVLPGVFETILPNEKKGINRVRVLILPGDPGERSLMVDTGYGTPSCQERVEWALATLGVECATLDLFVTHKHLDHCGLAAALAGKGARVHMNPVEDRHRYDALYQIMDSRDPAQVHLLGQVGITPEKQPEAWARFVRYDDQVKASVLYTIQPFDYTHVAGGDVFSCGGYRFHTVWLPGHTMGQMGLYEPDKKLFLCADQVIDGVAPIVGTSFPDEHLLAGYFRSLADIKHKYSDGLVIPAHGPYLGEYPAWAKGWAGAAPVPGVRHAVDKIVFAYLDKVDMIKHILDASKRRLTVMEVACIAYGIEKIPEGEWAFFQFKMIVTKAFSILEYLYEEEFALRTEIDGTLYWESATR
ncbi:MAG: MBL fold metallo-hydrolase [Lachnospiraceae bacterium]|jgi:glyoxylase-like metal-dependent hydrolase (beta-lactamase superfamily II)|nr:MBL fold metallo-hydrolase [Lachnospiraceae bacterium]